MKQSGDRGAATTYRSTGDRGAATTSATSATSATEATFVASDLRSREATFVASDLRSRNGSTGDRGAATTYRSTGQNPYELLEWENVNLLDLNGLQTKKKQLCFCCKAKALYEGIANNPSCGRHIVKSALCDLSGNKITKLPTAKVLREILLLKEPVKKSIQKVELLERLRNYYSIPLQQHKEQKASTVDFCVLHDSIRSFVMAHKEAWSHVGEICLENQPVFMNPHMKSVQMILFATLRDVLVPIPPIRFVHAGTKVKGEGYTERKKGAEDRVSEYIGTILDPSGLIARYQEASKKDDMADVFCMAMDALKKQS